MLVIFAFFFTQADIDIFPPSIPSVDEVRRLFVFPVVQKSAPCSTFHDTYDTVPLFVRVLDHTESLAFPEVSSSFQYDMRLSVSAID